VAPAREQSAYGGTDLGRLAKIADCGDDFDTAARGLAGRELETRFFDIDQVEVGTLIGERNGDRASDAGRGAGDKGFSSANDPHRSWQSSGLPVACR
jgi:hypothetical protein